MYNLLENLYVFFSRVVNEIHTVLRDRMKQVENALKLRNLSKTRLVYRNESIEAVWNSFEAITKGVTEVTEKDNNETTNFRCPLQCQINMNLVFYISEEGSKIELKHCASLKTSVSRHENISCT